MLGEGGIVGPEMPFSVISFGAAYIGSSPMPLPKTYLMALTPAVSLG